MILGTLIYPSILIFVGCLIIAILVYQIKTILKNPTDKKIKEVKKPIDNYGDMFDFIDYNREEV